MVSLRHIKRPPHSRSVTGRNTVISVLLRLDQDHIAVKSRSGLLPLSCIDFRETMQIFSTTSLRRSGRHNTASPSFRTEEASVLLPRTSLRRRAMQMHNSEANWDCQAKGLFRTCVPGVLFEFASVWKDGGPYEWPEGRAPSSKPECVMNISSCT